MPLYTPLKYSAEYIPPMYNPIITLAFHKILATTALCLAAMGLNSCLQMPESAFLSGKALVLRLDDTEMRFEFADSDVVRKSSRFTPLTDGTERQIWQEIYYVYSPEKAEFYEESRINSASGQIHDGYGYSRWHLQFNTASAGTATLIDKHPFAFQGHKVGLSVTFRIDPMSPHLPQKQIQEKTL